MRYRNPRRTLQGDYQVWTPGASVMPAVQPPPLTPTPMPPPAALTDAQAFDLATQWDRRVATGGEPAARSGRPKGQIPGAIPFRYLNAANALLPAVGSEVVVVSFRVLPGMNAQITRIANQLVTGGWNQGTGQLSWRVQVDGLAYQGYNSLNASIGTVPLPADLTEAPIEAKENQLVELILANVSLVVGGSNPALGLFAGYFYPMSEAETGAWY